VQNAAKHAGASAVAIRIAQSGSALEVSVVDDGVGFDPASAGSGGGLRNIADRIEAVGGSVEIRSAPGAGTSVLASIPLAEARGAP
jgi:signal transduction histidine kinase